MAQLPPHQCKPLAVPIVPPQPFQAAEIRGSSTPVTKGSTPPTRPPVATGASDGQNDPLTLVINGVIGTFVEDRELFVGDPYQGMRDGYPKFLLKKAHRSYLVITYRHFCGCLRYLLINDTDKLCRTYIRAVDAAADMRISLERFCWLAEGYAGHFAFTPDTINEERRRCYVPYDEDLAALAPMLAYSIDTPALVTKFEENVLNILEHPRDSPSPEVDFFPMLPTNEFYVVSSQRYLVVCGPQVPGQPIPMMIVNVSATLYRLYTCRYETSYDLRIRYEFLLDLLAKHDSAPFTLTGGEINDLRCMSEGCLPCVPETQWDPCDYVYKVDTETLVSYFATLGRPPKPSRQT